MTSRTTGLALVAAMGFTTLCFGPTFAQDQAAPAEQPAATVPGDAANAAGLSLGTPAGGGEPKVGDTYVSALFESWEQRCVKTADGADPCQLYQLLKDANGNAVAEASLFPLPPGGEAAAGATIVTPLETLLTAQLSLGIDAAQPKHYPFSFCSPIGCISRVGFTADEIAAMKKGNKATVSIVPVVAPDQVVALDISLKGFTAGFDAVMAANVAAQAKAQANAPAAPAVQSQAPAAPSFGAPASGN